VKFTMKMDSDCTNKWHVAHKRWKFVYNLSGIDAESLPCSTLFGEGRRESMKGWRGEGRRDLRGEQGITTGSR
jgi:hypothetical protein